MATKVRTSNSSRASTRIALGFAAIVVAGYFGYQYWSNRSIANATFAPITPTRVNILGIDTSMGFRIIVANGIAQVREATGEDFAAQADESEGGPKKRVPIKDMLRSMQGDAESLSRFVMALNDMSEDDLPPVRVYWTSQEIEHALAGDGKLVAKLESDLNVKLDGTPLPVLRPSVLDTGIVIKAPVEILLPVEGGVKKRTATILLPFEARMMKAVFRRIAERSEIDRPAMVGAYAEEAAGLRANPGLRENVAKSLAMMVSKASLQEKARIPERVIASTQVLINGAHVDSAKYEEKQAPRGPLYEIDLRLTDEGRRRLWKYSKGRVGSQLLLTVDGVAIAAPSIAHELSQTDLSITQINLDETLVRDAVDLINQEAKA